MFRDERLQKQYKRVIGKQGFKEDQQEVGLKEKNKNFTGKKYDSLVLKIQRDILGNTDNDDLSHV